MISRMGMGLGGFSITRAALGVAAVVGWIDPTAAGFAAYRNDYGVSWWSTGTRAISMMPTASTQAAWRGPFTATASDGTTPMTEVKMECVWDPTLQGTAASVRYLHNVTGVNTNDGLTPATAWKTVDGATGAIAKINADGSNTVFELRCDTSTYFGGNSAGWNAGNLSIGTVGSPKWIKIVNISSGRKWWLPGMRNNYLLATFAWVSKGGGVWACSTGSISVAAKSSNVVFDLSVLNADGAPAASTALQGPYADETAILAAMASGPSFFYQSSTTTWYVRLSSGNQPDPGNNFAYVETGVGNTFQIAETSPGVSGSRLMVSNFRAVHNCGTAPSSILFFVQPLTQTIGATVAMVQHDTYATFVDCEVYGSSGNAFGARDIKRMVRVRCKSRDCQIDVLNDHSIYTPGNSNSPEQGTFLHSYNEDCVGHFMGPSTIFRTQPAASTSCNGPTAHDRCHMTVIGGTFTDTNGSQCAITLGAKCLMIFVTLANPVNTTTGTGTSIGVASSRSNLWADGHSSTTSNDGSQIWSVYGSYTVTPNAGDGYNYYANDIAGIVVYKTLTPGKLTQRIGTTCLIVDQNGSAI